MESSWFSSYYHILLKIFSEICIHWEDISIIIWPYGNALFGKYFIIPILPRPIHTQNQLPQETETKHQLFDKNMKTLKINYRCWQLPRVIELNRRFITVVISFDVLMELAVSR